MLFMLNIFGVDLYYFYINNLNPFLKYAKIRKYTYEFPHIF